MASLRSYLAACPSVLDQATAVMATVRDYPAAADIMDELEDSLMLAPLSVEAVNVRRMWAQLRRDLRHP